MYETVREINGHRIYRMANTHGCYWVDVKENVQVSFRTIKAATAYIKSHF